MGRRPSETLFMSLKHAILVLLEQEDSSGYDLLKRFKEHLGFFWQASHQQLYKQLGQMHDAGLIDCQLAEQSGKPDKKIYSISPAGYQCLIDWMNSQSKPQKVNDSLLVKLYGGHVVAPEILLAEIQHSREQHEKTLMLLQTMEQNYLSLSAQAKEKYALPYLTLRRGILGEQAWLSWADEVETYLQILTKKNGA